MAAPKVTPEKMIDRLLTVPYLRGGGSFVGMDCWGVVELWYQHVLGVMLADRGKHQPGHAGLQDGFDARKDWVQLQAPENHCLVVMRAGRLRAGHIGVYYKGSVLHADDSHGCVYEPYKSPMIRSKVTGLFKRITI